MDIENRIKEIDKRLRALFIADMPGLILVGIWLYVKFGSRGDSFLPFHANELFLSVMLGTGLLIMGWCGFETMKLNREKERLTRKSAPE